MVQNFNIALKKAVSAIKLFVTLSSVAVSRQKGRSRVNKCVMWLIWTLGNQDEPMIALVLKSAPKKDFAIAKVRESAARGQIRTSRLSNELESKQPLSVYKTPGAGS